MLFVLACFAPRWLVVYLVAKGTGGLPAAWFPTADTWRQQAVGTSMLALWLVCPDMARDHIRV